MDELSDLLCSWHAMERWKERADQYHPSHNRGTVARYVMTQTKKVPSHLGADVFMLVATAIWRKLSLAREHLYYWDESDLLFVIVPPNYGEERRPYPVIRTVVKLTQEQDRLLISAMKEIEKEG